MPWDSASFSVGFNSWLSSLGAKSERETANIIATLYEASSTLTSPLSPTFLSVPIALKSKTVIVDGFENSFKLAKNIKNDSYEDLDAGIWLPAASSIVLYWTGVLFTPSPPPPGGLVGTSNSVVYAGNANLLAEDIALAFKSGTVTKAVDNLILAFQNHLRSISGVWIGTGPGVPPPPLTVPWQGLA